MDINSELKDTITESRQAKATKDQWVLDARSKASSHGTKKAMWVILIIILALGIGGLYIDALSIVSNYVTKVLGWVGLSNYTLYISIALIVLGLIRVVHHSNKKSQLLAFANQIESMALSAFRRQYM